MEQVWDVLLNNRKPSSMATYNLKWKKYIFFNFVLLIQGFTNAVLNLAYRGLSIVPKTSNWTTSSIKVHLAVILAFHPYVDNRLILSHVSVRVLKGLEKLYPQIRERVLLWGLNLVLSKPMGPPFEPLSMYFFLHISAKVAFLVATPPAQRVAELPALTSEPLYTMIFNALIQDSL